MANITAAEVNKLRQMTGAGMMDCKRALVEAEGDFEKAIDILRKKGQKVASKRAGKEANEGIVLAKATDDKKFAAVVKISCETLYFSLCFFLRVLVASFLFSRNNTKNIITSFPTC